MRLAKRRELATRDRAISLQGGRPTCRSDLTSRNGRRLLGSMLGMRGSWASTRLGNCRTGTGRRRPAASSGWGVVVIGSAAATPGRGRARPSAGGLPDEAAVDFPLLAGTLTSPLARSRSLLSNSWWLGL